VRNPTAATHTPLEVLRETSVSSPSTPRLYLKAIEQPDIAESAQTGDPWRAAGRCS
jgi:hypothetical protein